MRALSRCHRPALVALLVLAAAAPARADHCVTEMMYPGWQIATSEEAWENSALRHGWKRYPISNLLDGDPATAWVFEGEKWDGKERDTGWQALTGKPFGHGEGNWVAIHYLGKKGPVVDAVGVVNGYAKGAATYRRNNRITRLRIEPDLVPRGEKEWRPAWTKTVALRETRRMQIVPIPPTPVTTLTLYADGVAAGRDNDLCISEIQLFSKGRPVLPRPTRYLLYSPGDECGCGYQVFIVDRHGRPTSDRVGDMADWKILHDGLAVLYSQKGVVVFDLVRGRRLYSYLRPKYDAYCTWVTPTRLRIFAGEKKQVSRYDLEFSRRSVQVHKLPPDLPVTGYKEF